MKQSIYLHKQIVDVLRCYGDLEEVINKILQEAADGKFDVMNKPICPDRTGAGRYDIDIQEPNYLELLSTYGPSSSKISIRRLIYWFVDNEMYEELGWTQVREFEDTYVKIVRKKLDVCISELTKIKRYCSSSSRQFVDDTIDRLNILKGYFQYGY